MMIQAKKTLSVEDEYISIPAVVEGLIRGLLNEKRENIQKNYMSSLVAIRSEIDKAISTFNKNQEKKENSNRFKSSVPDNFFNDKTNSRKVV